MPKLEQLAEYKEYAEKVLELLRADESALANAALPDVAEQARRLGAAAAEVVRQSTSPVKVGILGEFSSGKTLLIGGLVGSADILPIDQVPTTGNVTQLRFTQHDRLEDTRALRVDIEYLTDRDVKGCFDYMLGVARRRLEETAHVAAPELLARLSALKPSEAGFSAALMAWCQEAWKTGSPNLQHLVSELRSFALAYDAAGHALCGRGRPLKYGVEPSVAWSGLRLPKVRKKPSELSYGDLPPAPPRLAQQPAELTAEILRNTFLLIKRVEVEVSLSRRLWELSPLRATNDFALLDFPGLGAPESGVRDEYLCLREMAEVHTILLLLNGRSQEGGTRQARKIYEILKGHFRDESPKEFQDRILVGVGHFDELPLSKGGGVVRALDQLLGIPHGGAPGVPTLDAATLTEEKVYGNIDVLGHVMANANDLTPVPSRVVFLSPPVYLNEMAERTPGLNFGSPGLMAEFASMREGLLEQRNRWRTVGDLLHASDPKSALTHSLRAFAEDGGVRSLRRLLETHVGEHGLRQVYYGTLAAHRKLAAELASARALVEAAPEVDYGAEPTSLSRAVEGLSEAYALMSADLRRRLPDLRVRSGSAFRPVEQRLSEHVQEELTFRVFDWDAWRLLFDRAVDGVIPPAGAEQRSVLNELLGDAPSADQGSTLHDTANGFYVPFEETAKQMVGFARSAFEQSVRNLLADFSERLQPQRDELQPFLHSEEVFRRVREGFGEDAYRTFKRLPFFADPQRLANDIVARVGAVFGDPRDEFDAASIFPLRRGRNGVGGQVFPWAAGAPANAQRADHQIQLVRIRGEMITSLRHHLGRLLSAAQTQLHELLKSIYGEGSLTLGKLSRNQDLLGSLALGAEDAKPSAPWVHVFRQVVSIMPPPGSSAETGEK